MEPLPDPGIANIESTSGHRSFYGELMAVLDELRREHPGRRYSFRSSVVQGLGLRDSFTAKIKSGQYRPTLDRLISLARFLEIHPSRFPSYAYRIAQIAIVEDPRIIELFRMLSTFDKEAYDHVIDAMLRLAKDRASGAHHEETEKI